MNTKDYIYSWHLSLRVDRPVEGCTMHPHAYMYGKKLDEREFDKTLPLHSKKMREPPPQHEFSYRWFRGPVHEACAYEKCPRRTSFSPHDWSRHALGGPESALQCVSTQSSLYKCTFCNADCFVRAWKTQYTVPRESQQSQLQQQQNQQLANMGGGQQQQHIRQTSTDSNHPYANNNGTFGGGIGTRTPIRSRSASVGSDMDMCCFDDAGSTRSSGSKSPIINPYSSSGTNNINSLNNVDNNPGTPRGYVGGFGNSASTNTALGGNNSPPVLQVFTSPGGGRGATASSLSSSLLLGGEQQSSSSVEWMEISRDQLFVPGPDDVGRKLKVEASAYSLESGELLMSRVVKTDVVLARSPDPMKRSLLTTKHPAAAAAAAASSSGPRFRVATYNVLAEIYATQQQYPYCDFWALSWDYRFQNIVREILDASPEVLCLQEIQADHYETHVYATLSEAGYEGVFKQKTRQSMGLAGKVDGCALFWRRSKFHLVESYSIEYNELAQRQATQLGLNNPGRGGGGDEYAAFLNRLSKDNVAQLVVLEFIQPTHTQQQSQSQQPSQQQPGRSGGGGGVGRGGSGVVAIDHPHHQQVCIANTHLYSNKDFPDVKLWQTWQLLLELESFIVGRGTNLPLVICGDFNSTPDTAVYDLLSRQAVHPGHPDVNVVTGDDNLPSILPDAMNMTHSFQLGSAYQAVLGEEPWTTNYTLQFKGVLDYIWYSASNILPLSAALIPDESQILKHGEALPSTEFSSDHMMLISDLQILPSNNGAR